jgi:hypothetical protein
VKHQSLVFRWLAIPWLQAELDKWVIMYNSSPRRANKHKTLPHGIPDLIHAKPERYNSKNFQVCSLIKSDQILDMTHHTQIAVSDDMFETLQQEWAPRDDPVFQLTPISFHQQADNYYTSLDRPAVSKGTFWDVYKSLLTCFRHHPRHATLEEEFNLANLGADQEMDLLPGLRGLRIGDEVVGDGVVHVHEDYFEAEFTDDEDDEDVEEYVADFTDDEDEG